MARVNTARATPRITPLSALSSDSISLCSKLKRLCFNFRRRREGSSGTGSDITTEYNTVNSDRYEDAPASPDRPTALELNTCCCACNSEPTPGSRVEPIVLDMNDFELVFDTPVCEICKQGYIHFPIATTYYLNYYFSKSSIK